MKKTQMATLFLGRNDKDTRLENDKTDDKISKICSILINFGLDGGTISDAHGFYKHNNGYTVIENSFRIELLDVPENMIVSICETLAQEFNQESVLAFVSNGKSDFVMQNFEVAR